MINICYSGDEKAWQIFSDLIEVLKSSFVENQADVFFTKNEILPEILNIIIGSTVFLDDFPFEVLDIYKKHASFCSNWKPCILPKDTGQTENITRKLSKNVTL